MILQDNPTGGIALLYGVTHRAEFTIDTEKTSVRETVVWDEYAICDVSEQLGVHEDSALDIVTNEVLPALFPNLDEKYYERNPYAFDYNRGQMSSLVTLYVYSSEGREEALLRLNTVFDRLADDLEEGHFSGDDTVFDYWPSEFGVAVAFAYDLDRLYGNTAHIERMRQVWDKRAAEYDKNTNDAMTEDVTPRP